MAREHVAAGRDPGLIRNSTKGTQNSEGTFEAVAEEKLKKFQHGWTESHHKGICGRIRRELFPWLGERPVGKVTAPELLASLRPIEARGHLENAHRTLTNAGQVFMYAIATGRANSTKIRDLASSSKLKLPVEHCRLRSMIAELQSMLLGRSFGFLHSGINPLKMLTGSC